MRSWFRAAWVAAVSLPCARAVRHWLRVPAVRAAFASACAASAMSGCGSIGYYWQAFDGQMHVVRSARPIKEVIQDPASPEALKAKLERVHEIRDFATRDLALPDNGSYRSYADLKRRYVVWNVFAAPALSVQPKEWCFPIAGCVGYRGYFSEADAKAFAQRLRAEGYDVFIGGVPAYSTLGWLDDPVLNTFIDYPDAELARLIFHELSHQVVYVPGDSVFNESFAVAVETEGVTRWIAAKGSPAEQAAFETAQRRRQGFAELVVSYRERLAALYASDATAQQKLARKEQAFAEMRADYERLKQGWGGYAGYDWWFAQPLNNAQLASVAIYTQLVPGFQKVLAQDHGDLPAFYASARKLGRLPKAERHKMLAGS